MKFHSRFLALTLTIAILLSVFAHGAYAQQQQANDKDLPDRIEWAKKIQSLQPIEEVVRSSVEQLSLRYPEGQRQVFEAKVLNQFDQESMDADAVKTMAEIFTLDELRAMHYYQSSAQGRSIAEKMPIYQTVLQKKLVTHLDKALMSVRTGGVE